MLVSYYRKDVGRPFKNFAVLVTQNAPPLLKQVTVNKDARIMIGVSTRKEWQLNELVEVGRGGLASRRSQ